MGCRAPPLPSELKYHACIIHDEAVSGADCRMLKGAVEESFAGAAVLLPEPTAEALLAAVRVSKCLLIFLTRGLLATPGSPRLAAVAEGVALGRGFVLVHEMDPGRGGTASFYDYIVETPDARAREIFNDATSIPWCVRGWVGFCDGGTSVITVCFEPRIYLCHSSANFCFLIDPLFGDPVRKASRPILHGRVRPQGPPGGSYRRASECERESRRKRLSASGSGAHASASGGLGGAADARCGSACACTFWDLRAERGRRGRAC